MKTPDSRHAPLRAHILTAYANVSGLPAPWGPKHAGILANFLRSCAWPIDKLTAAVDNRFQSDEINDCQDPAEWITKLCNYANGPLNKYGKPIYRQRMSENPMDGFEDAFTYFQRKDAGKVQ